jgi:hypothetical protein
MWKFDEPDVLDDGIGQPFPSFVLVRVGLTLANCETGIEQQNSLKEQTNYFK